MHKSTRTLIACSLLGATVSSLAAASLVESFDTGLTAGGAAAAGESVSLGSGSWYGINHSDSVGTVTGVFQGNNAVFPAQEGTNYAAFNYQMTTGANTISAWLISPELSFDAGDTVSFYTRTQTASTWPDRLFVRFSDAGASVDVGTTSSDVGDFDVVLGSVNPTLAAGGYPETYTLVSVVVPTTATGRIAFHYHVADGGPSGANSNYIGIDALTITAVPEPSAYASLAGIAALGLALRRRRQSRAE